METGVPRRFVLPLIAGAVPAISACGFGADRSAARPALIANPAKNEWPPEFWRASGQVQEAYRYALANPDVLQYMPCFCGCGSDGHRSNRDCYIREARADGSYVLDPMSFG